MAKEIGKMKMLSVPMSGREWDVIAKINEVIDVVNSMTRDMPAKPAQGDDRQWEPIKTCKHCGLPHEGEGSCLAKVNTPTEPVAPSELGGLRVSEFQKELRHLINRHCVENRSNTPDFILAEYMMKCLRAGEYLIERREQYYGRP